jgi:hypothetical protein
MRTFALLSLLAFGSIGYGQTVDRFTTQHVDLNLNYFSPDDIRVSVRSDDTLTNYLNTQNAMLLVTPAARRTYTGNETGDFSFIGAPLGGTYWRLPQGQNVSILYLGMAAYGVSSASIDTYDAATESSNRVTGQAAWARLMLHRVAGPGQISTWQSITGGVRPFVASSNGISSDDTVWLIAGNHLHQNVGFSAAGTYDVQFKGVVRTPNGNAATAGTEIRGRSCTIHFGVEADPAPISGTATLEDFQGDLESKPIFIGLRAPGSGTTTDTRSVFLMDPQPTQSGNVAEFARSTASRGNFDIVLKPRTFLSRLLSNQFVGPNGIQNVNRTFINGDIDGDDEISILDYLALSAAYETASGQPGYSADADLDGDGEVSILDYLILSRNYGLAGEAV